LPQGGILGSSLSTKYKLYLKLDGYCKDHEGTFFVTDELKLAVDDIYKYPLYENAKKFLGRMLNRETRIDEIIATVLDFRNKDLLVIKGDENETNKEPQIICSMGLKNQG
jgi:hypothetical protein